MFDEVRKKLEKIKLWNLLWISLAISEVFTIIMNIIMGLIWYGRIDVDLLLIGSIDAFVVAFFASFILILIFRQIRNYEIETRETIRRAEEEWQKTFNSMPDLIMILDTNHKIVKTNKAVADKLGKTPSQVAGIPYHELVHSITEPLSLCPLSTKMLDGQEHSAVVYEEGLGGYYLVTITPLFNTKGDITGSVYTAKDITESKRMELKLKKSEEQLQQAILVSQIGFFDHDHLAETIYWSPEKRKIYGWGLEETVSLPMLIDCIHPEDREKVAAAVRRAHDPAGNGSFDIEYRIIRSDNEARSVSTRSRTFFEGEGDARRAIRTVGASLDITGRKRAEEEIRMLKHSIDVYYDGAYWLDIDNRFVYVNDTGCKALGYAREELIGKAIYDVNAKVNAERMKEVWARLRQGGSLTVESVHRRKDASVFPVEVVLTFVCFGGKEYICGFARDITRRKLAEEKLRQNEEFIRNILDTVDEAFIVVGRDYRILTANRAYCLAVSCDDLIGKHCFEISHGMNIPCYEAGEDCAVRTVFETGRPHASLHTHLEKDGHEIYVETKAFPIKDGSGNVVSAIETINNITEKRLLEEERLKTQKLEAVGTLAGGIAHDFNNLLQGVFGYISLAKICADRKEKSVAALEQAEKALHMSVNLTSQLLTFSKGGKPLKKRIALQPVIEDAAKFALSGSRTECLFDMSDGLWHADADSGQIGQVIQNIVLNADQAMPEGGKVGITARNILVPGRDLPPVLKDGRYVKISIEDNGVGIAKQYLTKIFDPYFTTKEKGSGLGLATSYSIIKNHDGFIDVKSTPGKGSSFDIYIPAAETKAETQAPAPAAPPSRKGKILVMDDDEVIRSVARELIRSLGHDVDVAEHGEAAILKYKAAREAGGPFDIVILDLTVRGGMGGVETVRKLLEIDPEMKVVVSSGYSENAALADYRKRGFKSFLKKPYNVDELSHTLSALLT